MNEQQSLSRKLQVLRAKQALTYEEAAERTGVNPETLRRLECGHNHPRIVTLGKIAKGYGVPVEDLLW